MKKIDKMVVIIRWIARIFGLLFFLFWGAFFLEHLIEWFIKPLPQTPPLKIWIDQILHFILLAGFIMALRWELLGSMVILGSAALFFPRKEAIPFMFITMIPGVMFLFCYFASRIYKKKVIL